MKNGILLVTIILTFILALSLTACNEEITVAAISIEGQKTSFDLGDEFSLGDISVSATMSNGEKSVIKKSDLNVDSTKYNSTQAGTYKINVTYGGVMEQYEVVVSKFSNAIVDCGTLALLPSTINGIPSNIRNDEKYLQYTFTPEFTAEYKLEFSFGQHPGIAVNGNQLTDLQNNVATIKMTKEVKYTIVATINDESLTAYGLGIKPNDRLSDITLLGNEEYLLYFKAPAAGIINVNTNSESVIIQRIMSRAADNSFVTYNATGQIDAPSQVALFSSAQNEIFIVVKNNNSTNQTVTVTTDYIEVDELHNGDNIEIEIEPYGGYYYYELNVAVDSVLDINYSTASTATGLEPRLFKENGEVIPGYSLGVGKYRYSIVPQGRYYIGFYLMNSGVLNANIALTTIE